MIFHQLLISTRIFFNHVSIHLSNCDISLPQIHHFMTFKKTCLGTHQTSSKPLCRKTFDPSHAGLWGLARAARLECDFQIHMLDWSNMAVWLRSI